MRNAAHTTSSRWPFWLLIVAWVCANSPQMATYTVLTWIAEARTFSHQQHLTADVAHLLAGEKAPSRVAAIVMATNDDENAAPDPAVPAAAVLKKIDLSSEKTSEWMQPSMVAGKYATAGDRFGDALRAPPPHGPPRVERAS